MLECSDLPLTILDCLQCEAQPFDFVFKLVDLLLGLAPITLLFHDRVEASLQDVVVAFQAVLIAQKLLLLLHMLCHRDA